MEIKYAFVLKPLLSHRFLQPDMGNPPPPFNPPSPKLGHFLFLFSFIWMRIKTGPKFTHNN